MTGIQHNNATFVVATTLGLVFLTFSWQLAVIAFISGLLGIVLTPDLDQETLNRTENYMVGHRFLPIRILGLLYVGFFMPYAMMIPHRHFISHFPVVGTIVRLVYIYLLVLGMNYIAPYFFAVTAYIENLYRTGDYLTLAAVLFPLTMSDFVHYVMDTIPQHYFRANSQPAQRRQPAR